MDQDKINALRVQPVPAFSHLIDGKHVPASDGGVMDILSPIDGQVLTTTAKGTTADMEAAIASARTAFEDGRWAAQPPQARKKVLLKWADLIEEHALELAVLGVRDNGTEISMALKAEPGSAAGTIRYYAEALDKIYGEIAPTAADVLGMIHKEPVGVVGAIIPWNFPMMIGAWKLAPALAMGNCVVLKPSETASLSLMRMADLALEAGLPPGVLNAVTGEGKVVGEAMGLSMDVDVLVFTGSGGTGRRLMEYAARSNMKRVYLELGGKSPNIVFADAPDLAEAAKVAAAGIFRNAGQVCVAGSRLLVEASIHDDFVAAVVKATEAMRVGDPLNLGTAIGAVNSETQLMANLGFVETAQSEGGQIVTGGQRILQDTGGYFMAPTIVTGVTPYATLAQKEVFGPVLGVTPFTTDDEAIEIANSTIYGLAGAAWTSNLSRAHRMVRAVRTGVMHINTYGGADGTVPLGGVGQSGNGSDKSLHALEKYINLKTAWIKLYGPVMPLPQNDKIILVIGTYDTKDAELGFLADVIRDQGGRVMTMDVSVLGDPSHPCDYSKHDVAGEGGSSIKDAIASGDENTAMQIMAKGAARLTARLYLEGEFDGMIVLGGTMGTDLALDVACALPLGVPKYIVSTVSFSPLIPADRIGADVQMILWAGGLYGLNAVCRASLSQAAGAVLGAARAVQMPKPDKPLIGMMSLGTSALKYVIALKPALEERGYEVAVFHATGMGGRAFESLAAQGAFACVFDLCTQELGNHISGSNISAGADRLRGAGLNGTPQIVAPGCYDLVDIIGWQPVPDKWADHPRHEHNRLLTSIVLDEDERRKVAHAHGEHLACATGPVAMLLPEHGCGEWDREGADLHNAQGLKAFLAELEKALPAHVEQHRIACHINDAAFADKALEVFDDWCAKGLVAAPKVQHRE